MASITEEGPSVSSLLPRACDRCRSRKIKCDRIPPCNNCRAAGITCHASETPQEPRQRVLISNQYEKKIDAIESRLDGIENLLKTLVAKSSQTQRTTAAGSVASPSNDSIDSAHDSSSNSRQFEGESSLSAHSKHAHRTLESLLAAHPSVRYDPEVASALSSLQEMMQKQASRLSHQFTRLNLQGEDSAVTEEAELPPFEDVLALLQDTKCTQSAFFFVWCPYIDIKQFTQFCEELYFRPTDCSLANEAIVSVGLYYFYEEQSALPDSPRKYRDYAVIFRKRFSASLSRFSLLVTPSFDNVLALTLGAAFTVAVADYSTCLSLTSAAARMCQSLGWHRNVVVYKESPEYAEAKKLIFWNIYYFDKTLSLRLGCASTLQDFDIALDLPEVTSDPKAHSWLLYMNELVEIAAVHGLVYEKLYSPRALSQSPEDRIQTVKDLAARVQNTLPQGQAILERTTFHRDYMQLFCDSNEVILYCLLTLIYRAAPSAFDNLFIFNSNCLFAARAAIGAHLKSVKNLVPTEEQAWADYVNWTILICPFTPFMVVFCHAVSSCNLEDLKLLEEFVTSIDCPTFGALQALAKFHQLCNAFYTLAKRYIAARLRKNQISQGHSQHASLLDHQGSEKLNLFGEFQEVDMQLSDVPEPLSTNNLPDNVSQDQLDPSSQWFLSNTFDNWISGEQQSLDFLGSDWSTFGTL